MAIKIHHHFLLLLLSIIIISLSHTLEDDFCRCFSKLANSNSTSRIIFTPNNPSYQPLLQSSIRNLRFLNDTNSTLKPSLIVTPNDVVHVQAAILCSKRHNLQVRVRSGGHDYEGLSYTSSEPFILIDLVNLRSISINLDNETASVQAGATLGELYHAIAKASPVHGFPAGSCPTVGIGGHVSDGGFGTIFRKYGLAADNVVDVQMVDSNGNTLNKASMGEDLFWAVRGGGGSSFGIVIAFKVKIVHVPPTVTIFQVSRTLDPKASRIFQKWQWVAYKLPSELFLHAVMGVANKTITISFTGLYLGAPESVLELMKKNFTEVGLQWNDITEMSWIQSVLYFADYSVNSSIDVLLQRKHTFQSFKAKSDYVTQPIPLSGLEGLWKMMMMMMMENSQSSPLLILSPYGGRMCEISETETAFPHRRGVIYGIQYLMYWDSKEETEKNLAWMRRLYAYMEPYVSRNPRAAYLNYRDLDLGVNRGNHTSYEEAKWSWGLKYFKNNYERLAKVKARVDPCNFFRHEQSIPPLNVIP